MTKRKHLSEEVSTPRANKMLKIMNNDDNDDKDVDVTPRTTVHKTSANRKFNYTLNKKTAKKKLIQGASRIPFEKEVKSNCLVLHFNDGSYFAKLRPSYSSSWPELALLSLFPSSEQTRAKPTKPGWNSFQSG